MGVLLNQFNTQPAFRDDLWRYHGQLYQILNFRSRRTRIENLFSSKLSLWSLFILVRAVSVLWCVLKPDWNSSRILFDLRKQFICTEMIFSCIAHHHPGCVSLVRVLQQLFWRHLGRCLFSIFMTWNTVERRFETAVGTESIQEVEELHSSVNVI